MWNSLPLDIRDADLVNSFKAKLKTYSFNPGPQAAPVSTARALGTGFTAAWDAYSEPIDSHCCREAVFRVAHPPTQAPSDLDIARDHWLGHVWPCAPRGRCRTGQSLWVSDLTQLFGPHQGWVFSPLNECVTDRRQNRRVHRLWFGPPGAPSPT